jgi:hypothetical protein
MQVTSGWLGPRYTSGTLKRVNGSSWSRFVNAAVRRDMLPACNLSVVWHFFQVVRPQLSEEEKKRKVKELQVTVCFRARPLFGIPFASSVFMISAPGKTCQNIQRKRGAGMPPLLDRELCVWPLSHLDIQAHKDSFAAELKRR